MQQFSIKQARAITLHAQGFSSKVTDSASPWSKIHSTIQRIGLLQIDSVNVLVRSHYLPLYSRLGHYNASNVEQRLFQPTAKDGQKFFEYWGHEASVIPIEYFPLFRWRMNAAKQGDGVYKHLKEFSKKESKTISAVLEQIRINGPQSASEMEQGKKQAGWWNWSKSKTALEYLFWSGQVTSQLRRNNFERVYELTDRLIPTEIFDQPELSDTQAHQQLLMIAAHAFGIANERELRDYFRLSAIQSKAALHVLLDADLLTACTIENLVGEYYIPKGLKPRKHLACNALLSPFDPIVWNRPRAEGLFDFHYRIEIYTPAAKRKYGYYVLPFMINGELQGRVDLKSNRPDSTLMVINCYLQKDVTQDSASAPLLEELRRLAKFLSLDNLEFCNIQKSCHRNAIPTDFTLQFSQPVDV